MNDETALTPTRLGLYHGRQHKLYIMGITSEWLGMPIVLGARALPGGEAATMLFLWTNMEEKPENERIVLSNQAIKPYSPANVLVVSNSVSVQKKSQSFHSCPQ